MIVSLVWYHIPSDTIFVDGFITAEFFYLCKRDDWDDFEPLGEL